MYVIDEYDNFPRYTIFISRIDGEGLADGFFALPVAHVLQRARSNNAAKREWLNLDCASLADMAGNQLGLVEAPPPQPPPMQRDGNDDGLTSG